MKRQQYIVLYCKKMKYCNYNQQCFMACAFSHRLKSCAGWFVIFLRCTVESTPLLPNEIINHWTHTPEHSFNASAITFKIFHIARQSCRKVADGLLQIAVLLQVNICHIVSKGHTVCVLCTGRRAVYDGAVEGEQAERAGAVRGDCVVAWQWSSWNGYQ